MTNCGAAVKNDAGLGPHLDAAGPFGGQEEGHVDIAEIDHVQHLAARVEHLAGLGDAKLHAAIARAPQGAVVDIRLNSFDCRLGGDDLGFRLDDVRLGSGDGRVRRCHVGLGSADGCLGAMKRGSY